MATSIRLSPPCGANVASSRQAARAPGAMASTSWCVNPCQSPKCVSRRRSSTETPTWQRSASAVAVS
ncbi:Uncharacterised protein [Mycobacteroides abscessus subsp. abscessus]|nr:Uncharacterised protein [Mycobacteroides abscessus subsp. abscessus]